MCVCVCVYECVHSRIYKKTAIKAQAKARLALIMFALRSRSTHISVAQHAIVKNPQSAPIEEVFLHRLSRRVCVCVCFYVICMPM